MDYELFDELEELLENEEYQKIIDIVTELDESELNSQLSVILAHAYCCLDRFSEGAKVLQNIESEVEDDDIAFHFELANCYYGQHKYLSAIKETEKCLNIDEEYVDAWILLCYIYSDKDDKEKFEYASKKAKELDYDSWNEFFGTDSQQLDYPTYSQKEIEIISKHIEKYFGKIYKTISYDEDAFSPAVIAIIKPTKEKNYYKLITVGMGAYKANVPKEIAELNLDRIELVSYLPPDWNVESMNINDCWIGKYMQVLSGMIQYEDTWLGFGHTISNGSPFASNTQFNGIIIDSVHNVELGAYECDLSEDDIVSFYQFIPIYEQEMLYKLKNASEDLLKLLKNQKQDYIGIIDINRPNLCVDLTQKKWAIPVSSIESILDWSGADGCFATDKIMVENKKVGYMYREKPDNEYDSGWRFMAGDETQEYMNDPDNMGIFSLNTVCNYDDEIIDFLESPVGSAFYRDKNGNFVKDKHFHKE